MKRRPHADERELTRLRARHLRDGKRIRVLRARIQRRCKHPKQGVVEGEYSRAFFNAMPPFRVCALCGYAEEGWGAGYWRLACTSAVPTLPRDEALKLVIGDLVAQGDMRALGRYGKDRK